MDSQPRTENSAYGRKPDGKSMHGRIVRELDRAAIADPSLEQEFIGAGPDPSASH